MVTNLGLLGVFKYAGFFVYSARHALAPLGVNPDLLHLDLVLPVGISFYTFQTMSYSIDVYRGRMQPVRNFIDFALFVAFFPQLVAGPIERARQLAPQFSHKPVVTHDMLRVGCWLIFWGLFKKTVVADNMAGIVDIAFAGPDALSGGDILIALYAFAFQIYADFSGYSDMARGMAKLMGYELMLNFRLPYFATNPSDFWRRWPISLSSWLRDYLYIPLGGNRRGKSRTYINLVLTMVLGGLWHGAAWTFVAWGGLHGGLLAAHRWLQNRDLLPNPTGRVSRAVWWTVSATCMFHFVCLGWLMFRAQSFEQFSHMTVQLVSDPTFSAQGVQWAWTLVLFCFPLVMIMALQGVTGDINAPLKLSFPARYVLYTVLLTMMITLGSFGAREFIYFQF